MKEKRHISDIDSLGNDNRPDTFYMAWGDTITLIMVFFIFLYSISRVDSEQFGFVSGAIKEYLQVSADVNAREVGIKTGSGQEKGGGELAQDRNRSNLESEKLDAEVLSRFQQEVEELNNIYQKLSELIGKEKLSELLSVKMKNNRISLNVGNALLFDLASAELKSKSSDVLEKIGLIIKKSDSSIVVEGHTDDIPISTARYPSNWELSTARAAAVVRYLKSIGVSEDRFSVIGYSKFRPLGDNNTPVNRAQNRRVTIILKVAEEDTQTHEATL